MHVSRCKIKLKPLYIVFVAIFGLVCLGAIWFVVRPPCHRLSCVGFEGSGDWHVAQVYEESSQSVFRALYKGSSDMLLRVDVRDNINPSTAKDYIHGRIAGMKALYDNIRSPYPGLISNEITCEESLKPSYTSFTTSKGLLIYQIDGFLNNRLVFGACTKDQIAYQGITVLFNCPSRKQLYDMEFIAPIGSPPAGGSQEKFQTIAQSIECR